MCWSSDTLVSFIFATHNGSVISSTRFRFLELNSLSLSLLTLVVPTSFSLPLDDGLRTPGLMKDRMRLSSSRRDMVQSKITDVRLRVCVCVFVSCLFSCLFICLIRVCRIRVALCVVVSTCLCVCLDGFAREGQKSEFFAPHFKNWKKSQRSFLDLHPG